MESCALSGRSFGPMSPSVAHAFTFPLHLLLLGVWMDVIFLMTAWNACLVAGKTLVFGSKVTKVTMESVFENEIVRAGEVVRLLGEGGFVAKCVSFSMFPLSILVDVVVMVNDTFGVLVAMTIFAGGGLFMWWFVIFVLPWCAVVIGWICCLYGLCCGVIEMAS